MLKYLIIPLSSEAVSYCHYKTNPDSAVEISPAILAKAIKWSMKNNVYPQFVYPSHKLSAEIYTLTDEILHSDIVPSTASDQRLIDWADVVVFDGWNDVESFHCNSRQAFVVRTSFNDLIDQLSTLIILIEKANRINVSITDIERFGDKDNKRYSAFLESLIPSIIEEYKKNHPVQLNLLTDRLMYSQMNNCNAGVESLALSIDGNFFICPAFIPDNSASVGSLDEGIDIKNPQLYKLNHAPICRVCDAWHCKRCIWQNKKMTREINTPSHQQCIVSHTERNASIKLLDAFHKSDLHCFENTEIPDLGYLDPFYYIIKKSTK